MDVPTAALRRSGSGLAFAVAAATGCLIAAAAGAVAVAAGAEPVLEVGGRPLLRADAVTAVVAPVLALVACTVALYARRNLHGDRAEWRFAAAATALATSTLVLLTAARLSVLVGAWMAGSIATVGLCGYRGDRRTRGAAHRAGVVLGAGDLALVVALLVVLAAVGDPDLRDLGAVADRLGSRTVATVGVLVGLAALARAGQLPFPPWLAGTVNAPTPVSALLHAGSVNAGGVLLARCAGLTGAALAASAVIVVGAVASIARSWGAAAVRSDVKGALAESTGAQMGFMLAACAVGAPAAAVSHLVGHALYKSARFLGAGGAVGDHVTRRRFASSASSSPAAVAATVAGAVAVGALWWWASGASEVPTPERWLVGAGLVVALGHAVGQLARRGLKAGRTAPVALAAAGVAVGSAVLVHRATADTVIYTGDHVDARVLLVALGLAAAAQAWLPVRPRRPDRPHRGLTAEVGVPDLMGVAVAGRPMEAA